MAAKDIMSTTILCKILMEDLRFLSENGNAINSVFNVLPCFCTMFSFFFFIKETQ
jgi:hypothetical protein